jgi:putative transposase
MKYTAQYYVNRINKQLHRIGTLWQSRFYSCLVPTERYALACHRYIELNPVEAGMVRHASDYRWSSYRANAGNESVDFLRAHPAYEALGAQISGRAATYAAMFDSPLEQSMVDEIRSATRAGHVLGADRKRPGRPPRGGK